MMSTSWFIIANPVAGNHNFSKQWKKIKQLFNNKNILFTVAFSNYSKHEIKLVQNAIQKGFRNIISIGGDGTLHHIVNGIMLQKYVKSSEITIGVIPLGTGNDWIKTYKIPNNIKKAIEIICERKIVLQDIGVIQTKNKYKKYFNNLAGLGYDGYIVYKLKKLKKLGSIAYLLSGLSGLFFYKKSILKIQFNNKTIESNCLMTLVGICKFSGGGMQLTKDVNTADGFFDITIAKNLNLIELILNIHKLYNGEILNHKNIETYKTKEISIIPKNSTPFIQADGELIGIGQVKIKIIEKAIKFVVSKNY